MTRVRRQGSSHPRRVTTTGPVVASHQVDSRHIVQVGTEELLGLPYSQHLESGPPADAEPLGDVINREGRLLAFDTVSRKQPVRFAVLAGIMRRLASSEAADRTWRAQVLDTREHVAFLAQVVDRAGRESASYDSGDALSGGQQQKLVIFCLAAALRYQLTDADADVPGYGTVVLDEAFDKADSSYTRMAMNIFTEFGFHMILATPQKLLQTLEPYVGAITAVSNPSQQSSQLANAAFERAESA